MDAPTQQSLTRRMQAYRKAWNLTPSQFASMIDNSSRPRIFGFNVEAYERGDCASWTDVYMANFVRKIDYFLVVHGY